MMILQSGKFFFIEFDTHQYKYFGKDLIFGAFFMVYNQGDREGKIYFYWNVKVFF